MRQLIPILSLPLLFLSASLLPAQEKEGASILVGGGYSRGTANADFGETGRYRDVSDGDIGTESAKAGLVLPIGDGGDFGLIARVSYMNTTAEYVYDRRTALVMQYDLLSPVEGDTIRTLSFGGEISLKFGL